jgi:hypothetical protein
LLSEVAATSGFRLLAGQCMIVDPGHPANLHRAICPTGWEMGHENAFRERIEFPT